MVRKDLQGDATLCAGNMRSVKGEGFGHHNSSRFKDAPIADVHRSLHDHLQPEAVMCVPRQPVTRSHMRSEEHTSELQSLMRISYAVFCLKKKTENSKQKVTRDKHIMGRKTSQ